MPPPAAASRRATLRAGGALVAAVLLAGCGWWAGSVREPPDAPAPAAGERGLQYVVIAHPDDEYQGWGLIGGRDDTYPVFLLLTRGEVTGRCDGEAFQPERGERPPEPQPFDPTDVARCAEQRVDSWHAFLDGIAELEDGLDPEPEAQGRLEGEVASGETAPEHPFRSDPAVHYDVYVGADHARLVFDLGDGTLTADEVAWAVHEARRTAGEGRFPVEAEREILGANFANADGHPDCVDYDHPDHVAVDEALWEVDFGVPGPQRNRACATDPRVRDGGETVPVPPEVHEQVWAVEPRPEDPVHNPDAERVGVAQRVYGWLAFTFGDEDARTYWEVSDDEADTIFAREQHFWRAHD
ncbi:hypothetical protein ER308_14785 [Egibacter rhizosphaerae]|uniref:Uncharacterized protein n=1 Tax=Egibacter rhizosphaerae TaxID=1670831 RepID=A0A411YHV3_9ACTN|nr:hypothetical protein [Egibacter rhizosphaerae]QBI20701.1 hypothetical protein ER308_14785 [Egibacter rhizosphaerae]